MKRIRNILALFLSLALIVGASAGVSALDTLEPFEIENAYVVDVSYIESSERYMFSCAAVISGYGDGYTPFIFSLSAEDITNSDGSAASAEQIEAFKTLTISYDGIMLETYPLQLGLAYSASGSPDTSLTEEEQVEYAELFSLNDPMIPAPAPDAQLDSGSAAEPDYDANPPTGVMICSSLAAAASAALYIAFNRRK